MRKPAAILGAVMVAAALAACGSDEGGDEPKGEDFAGQANAICVDANRKLVEINLELGYEVDEQDAVERLERVLPLREQTLSQFETLEPPADQAEGFDAFLATRQDLVDGTEAQLDAYESGTQKQIREAGADTAAAGEESAETATDIGLSDCGGKLPSDDAKAAEDVLREHLTTNPLTSCTTDGLVTEVYLEEKLGGVARCKRLQIKNAEDPERLFEDITVSGATGVDEVIATLEFKSIGGSFDSAPLRGILYYVDGGWKIYSIQAIE